MSQLSFKLESSLEGANKTWVREVIDTQNLSAFSLVKEKEIIRHLAHLKLFIPLQDSTVKNIQTFSGDRFKPLSDEALSYEQLIPIMRMMLEKLCLLHSEGYAHLNLSLSTWWLDSEGELWLSSALNCRHLDEWGNVIDSLSFTETEETKLTWSDDLFNIGKILKELLEKIHFPESEKHLLSAIEQLMVTLLSPNPIDRGVSLVETLSRFRAILGKSFTSLESVQEELDEYLNKFTLKRVMHRKWCLYRCQTIPMLSFSWDKGWSFKRCWKAYVIPQEVCYELIEDFKKGSILPDKILEWMACSKRGLPLKVLSHLGVKDILEKPFLVLEKWLHSNVLSIEGDRCVWSDSKLQKAIASLFSEAVQKVNSEKVIKELRRDKSNDISMLSQAISLVNDHELSDTVEDKELLWEIHYRALKQYQRLEKWESVLSAAEWLWVHRGYKNVDTKELMQIRLECYITLKQFKLAEQQFELLPKDHGVMDITLVGLRVRLVLEQNKKDEALSYLNKELERSGAPWLKKTTIFKMRKAKEVDIDPVTASRLQDLVRLYKFNKIEWKKQLSGFKLTCFNHLDYHLRHDFQRDLYHCFLANADIESLKQWLEDSGQSHYPVKNILNEVDGFVYDWLQGAPAEVVLEKIDHWLNIPLRRRLSDYREAKKLKSILDTVIYGKEIEGDSESYYIFEVCYDSLQSNWGDVQRKSPSNISLDGQWISGAWHRLHFALSHVFKKSPEVLNLNHIWLSIKKDLKVIQLHDSELGGYFLIYINTLEMLMANPEEACLSEMELLHQIYQKQEFRLSSCIVMTAIEDLKRMGWVNPTIKSWPSKKQRWQELGYWGLIGDDVVLWGQKQNQKDPLLNLLQNLSHAENHEERLRYFTNDICHGAGATHVCCWISWGESWLPSFKYDGSENERGWEEELKTPSLKGPTHEVTSMTTQFKDELWFRMSHKNRTYVIFIGNDTYHHSFGPKQQKLVDRMIEYAMGSIENGLVEDWSRSYYQKLLPENHPAKEMSQNESGFSPLEGLENRLDRVIQGLQNEKDEMKRKNDAWREQVHEEMQKHDQLQSLGRLVASLAHEINNPNSFVKINAPMVIELWKQYINPNPEHPLPKKFIEERIPALLKAIEEGADRIDHLVQDLKNFARQNHDEKVSPVNLLEIIEVALRMNKKYIEHHTQNFMIEMPKSVSPIAGIAHRLEQVIVNLIHNACDALVDTKSVVKLSVVEDKGYLQVLIKDEGCGMSPEVLSKIYEPFYTTKDTSHGMGMGMTVVKNIVDQHKASIKIESSLGEGSTFRLYFPILK